MRSGPQRITAAALCRAAALCKSAEWLLLARITRDVAACVIYLHMVAFGAVLLSGFWSLMNESFDPRSAKELFGRIGGMGTLGGLCRRIARRARGRLVRCRGRGAAAGRPASGLRRPAAGARFPAPKRAARDRLRARNQRDRCGAPLPVSAYVAGLVLAASAGAALLDFVFKAQAAHTFGQGAPLVRFFGSTTRRPACLIFLVQTFWRVRAETRRSGSDRRRAARLRSRLGSVAALLLPGLPGAQRRSRRWRF